MTAFNLAVAICLITTAGLSECFVYPDTICTTPDGNTGTCLQIRECKPVKKLLESYASNNTAPPAYLYENLRKLRCNVDTTPTKICCASTPANAVQQTTPKIDELISLGKSVTDSIPRSPTPKVESLDTSETDSIQASAPSNPPCTTLDGSVGDCVEIRECKPVMKLFDSYANTNTTPPAHVYDNLRKIRCNVGTSSVKICCTSTAINSFQQTPKFEKLISLDKSRNSVCTTPNGSVGNCIEIRECKPVMNLFESYANTNTTPPARVYDYLRKIRCNLSAGSVQVCCANTRINLNSVQETFEKPEALLSLDESDQQTFQKPETLLSLDESDRQTFQKPEALLSLDESDQKTFPKPEVLSLDDSEQDRGNSSCVTPDNSAGVCVAIRECKSVMKILESYATTNTSPPAHVYGYLRQIKCDGNTSSVKICCSHTPLKLNLKPVQQTTPKPEELLSLDKSEKDKAETNHTCITPSGFEGNCVNIHECSPVMQLLEAFKNINTTLPNQVFDYIRKMRCNSDNSPIKVCCPQPLKQNTPKREELLPLDQCGKNDGEEKVALGKETALFDFPWMAQLAYQTSKGVEYLCGGTLISDRYVLTAAHCIPRNSNIKLLHARVGEHNMSSPIDCTKLQFGSNTCAEPPQDIEIESVVPHPNFNITDFSNDIALLRLKTKANTSIDTVTPICLPVFPSVRNVNISRLVVTGWGLTENMSRSDVLLMGSVSIMDPETCAKIYTNINVSDFHICVGDGTGVNSCRGDSGGPLQSMQNFNGSPRYIQYGVISVGPKTCGSKGQPGIHTRIDYYLEWVLNSIKP